MSKCCRAAEDDAGRSTTLKAFCLTICPDSEGVCCPLSHMIGLFLFILQNCKRKNIVCDMTWGYGIHTVSTYIWLSVHLSVCSQTTFHPFVLFDGKNEDVPLSIHLFIHVRKLRWGRLLSDHRRMDAIQYSESNKQTHLLALRLHAAKIGGAK